MNIVEIINEKINKVRNLVIRKHIKQKKENGNTKGRSLIETQKLLISEIKKKLRELEI